MSNYPGKGFRTRDACPSCGLKEQVKEDTYIRPAKGGRPAKRMDVYACKNCGAREVIPSPDQSNLPEETGA